MKRHLACLFLGIFLFAGCSTPTVGIVTDKAIDPPRYVRYPAVGVVTINSEPIYWLELDNDGWAPVPKSDFDSHKIGWLWAAE
jgi:hypothetical protein